MKEGIRAVKAFLTIRELTLIKAKWLIEELNEGSDIEDYQLLYDCLRLVNQHDEMMTEMNKHVLNAIDHTGMVVQ